MQTIRFRKPGKGKMRTEFRLTDAQLDEIRDQLKTQERIEPKFMVQVRDESGDLVAEVEKVMHVRKKLPQHSTSASARI